MVLIAKIPDNVWYDIYEDWHLIEASFAKQYGIRLRENLDMPFSEFQELLAGLMPDTPLGNIISIRSENNDKVLKSFTPEMRRERSRWRNKQAQMKLENPEKLQQAFDSFEKLFAKLYS